MSQSTVIEEGRNPGGRGVKLSRGRVENKSIRTEFSKVVGTRRSIGRSRKGQELGGKDVGSE